MTKKRSIEIILLSSWISILLVIFVILSGCSAPQQPSAPPNEVTSTPTVTTQITQLTTISTTITTASIASPAQTSNITPNITTQKVTITATPEKQTTLAGDNPYLENLQFRKSYFYINIPNCPMQEIFPTIAKDPDYGLNKPVPKIAAISSGEYNKFLREFTEGKNENTKLVGVSRCEGAISDPYWNFVEISVKVTALNTRPANYTVSLNVRSQGKIVGQFKTIELLTKDQIITFTSYVPLKTDEMSLFDGAEITFNKLLN